MLQPPNRATLSHVPNILVLVRMDSTSQTRRYNISPVRWSRVPTQTTAVSRVRTIVNFVVQMESAVWVMSARRIS